LETRGRVAFQGEEKNTEEEGRREKGPTERSAREPTGSAGGIESVRREALKERGHNGGRKVENTL